MNDADKINVIVIIEPTNGGLGRRVTVDGNLLKQAHGTQCVESRDSRRLLDLKLVCAEILEILPCDFGNACSDQCTDAIYDIAVGNSCNVTESCSPLRQRCRGERVEQGLSSCGRRWGRYMGLLTVRFPAGGLCRRRHVERCDRRSPKVCYLYISVELEGCRPC